MTTSALRINNDGDLIISWTVLSIILLFIAGGVTFLIAGKLGLAVGLMAIPVVIAIISYPKAAIYLYIFSLFIYLYPATSLHLLFIDIVSLLFLASFAIDFLVRAKGSVMIPSVIRYGIFLLGALIFVTLFSSHPEYAYSPILRVALQLAIIIAIYNLISGNDVGNLLKFYFWLMVFHSIYNFGSFIVLKGEYRIFGFPGVYYDDLAMLAFPIGLAYFIWSGSRKDSVLYGLGTVMVSFGLLATQSRGPSLTVVWVGAFILIYSWIKAGREENNHVRKRLKMILWGIVPVLIVLVGFAGVFRFALERFQGLSDIHSGTIWYRFSLWRASLLAFMNDPLTGIGPGCFRYIENILPILRFDEAQLYVQGLSAHNMFLHYLAESGLIGAAALVAFYSRNFLVSKRLVEHNRSSLPTSLTVALFGIGLMLLGTIFYMDGWGWGQNAFAAPFFFALTARAANHRING